MILASFFTNNVVAIFHSETAGLVYGSTILGGRCRPTLPVATGSTVALRQRQKLAEFCHC
jgi:hypothetical protein